MPLSPDEIQSKEFDLAERGYEKDQVRAFLTTVAADYRAALRLGNHEAADRPGDDSGPNGAPPETEAVALDTAEESDPTARS